MFLAPIVGGQPAQVGDFPNVVVVDVNGTICTGTLIAPAWVLTAAHCLVPMPPETQDELTGSTRVHTGTVDVLKMPGTELRVAETIPDPEFKTLGSHDAGLVHLQQPITDITPVALNFDPAHVTIGSLVTLVGYGKTMSGGLAGQEYSALQTIVACAARAGTDADLLCFDQSNGIGVCDGDSGGPAFMTTGGKTVQVGLTSFGDGSCTMLAADTRVDAERDFILAHVPELCDANCGGAGGCDAGGDASLWLGAVLLLRRRRR